MNNNIVIRDTKSDIPLFLQQLSDIIPLMIFSAFYCFRRGVNFHDVASLTLKEENQI